MTDFVSELIKLFAEKGIRWKQKLNTILGANLHCLKDLKWLSENKAVFSAADHFTHELGLTWAAIDIFNRAVDLCSCGISVHAGTDGTEYYSFDKYSGDRAFKKDILLIGENDFSYAITHVLKTKKRNVIASEFNQNVLNEPLIRQRIKYLVHEEVVVLIGLDARNIANYFPDSIQFERIQFNCPFSGGDKDPFQREETRKLVQDFLVSARDCCHFSGHIVISLQSPKFYDDSNVHWGRKVYHQTWGLDPDFIEICGLHFVGLEKNIEAQCVLTETECSSYRAFIEDSTLDSNFCGYKPHAGMSGVKTFTSLAFSRKRKYDSFDLWL